MAQMPIPLPNTTESDAVANGLAQVSTLSIGFTEGDAVANGLAQMSLSLPGTMEGDAVANGLAQMPTLPNLRSP